MNADQTDKAPDEVAAAAADSEGVKRLREEGRAAGFDWAAEEARRGYLHPLELEQERRIQIVIEHAQAAFGGRCRGRPRDFIRGFVQGVAQFWRVRGRETADPGKTLAFPCETALIRTEENLDSSVEIGRVNPVR